MSSIDLKTIERYSANSWPVKISSNGRYICAPTADGRVFMWNIRTCNLVGVLADHVSSASIRDCSFHPYRKWFLTCGDDGLVCIYTEKKDNMNASQTLEVTTVTKEITELARIKNQETSTKQPHHHEDLNSTTTVPSNFPFRRIKLVSSAVPFPTTTSLPLNPTTNGTEPIIQNNGDIERNLSKEQFAEMAPFEQVLQDPTISGKNITEITSPTWE
eukprot:TRINITY_DN1306_c0_g1_i4.p1 TRINITY_DN1306_c0_g1~~TRINITY_DN1306_c0_g1_i4.p1  ORF type:complete len:216 (+),score=25.07 TRINITY_DN1306_c0_g1_i4:43-690(+)